MKSGKTVRPLQDFDVHEKKLLAKGIRLRSDMNNCVKKNSHRVSKRGGKGSRYYRSLATSFGRRSRKPADERHSVRGESLRGLNVTATGTHRLGEGKKGSGGKIFQNKRRPQREGHRAEGPSERGERRPFKGGRGEHWRRRESSSRLSSWCRGLRHRRAPASTQTRCEKPTAETLETGHPPRIGTGRRDFCQKGTTLYRPVESNQGGVLS